MPPTNDSTHAHQQIAHQQDTAHTQRRLARRRRRQFAALRRIGLFILITVLWLGLRIAFPGPVWINNTKVPVGRGWTVEDCARSLQVNLKTGDLLAVDGSVIKSGGGLPGEAWRGNEPVALDARLKHNDHLQLLPTKNKIEPITDNVKLMALWASNPSGKRVRGLSSREITSTIKRVNYGKLSHKLYGEETTWAVAVAKENPHPHKKRVAFTFDDGPNPAATPKILAEFRKYNGHATFFVLGQGVAPLSAQFSQIVADGHEIGTHSWNHKWFTKLTPMQMRNDLQRCKATIKAHGVDDLRLFRPPYGAHNRTVDAIAHELGLKIAMWDIDPYDWRRPGAQVIHDRVMKRVCDGSVVLLHDGGGERAQTVKAVQMLLKSLSARGYEFVTMSEVQGISEPFTDEVNVTVAGQQYFYTPLEGIKISIDGKPIMFPDAPLKCNDEIFVPGRLLAEALGAQVEYDKANELLEIIGSYGKMTIRIGLPEVEMNQVKIKLPAPTILYKGQAMIPLALMKHIMPLSIQLDELINEIKLRKLQSFWPDILQMAS